MDAKLILLTLSKKKKKKKKKSQKLNLSPSGFSRRTATAGELVYIHCECFNRQTDTRTNAEVNIAKSLHCTVSEAKVITLSAVVQC